MILIWIIELLYAFTLCYPLPLFCCVSSHFDFHHGCLLECISAQNQVITIMLLVFFFVFMLKSQVSELTVLGLVKCTTFQSSLCAFKYVNVSAHVVLWNPKHYISKAHKFLLYCMCIYDYNINILANYVLLAFLFLSPRSLIWAKLLTQHFVLRLIYSLKAIKWRSDVKSGGTGSKGQVTPDDSVIALTLLYHLGKSVMFLAENAFIPVTEIELDSPWSTKVIKD